MTQKAGPGKALKLLRQRESWTLSDVSRRTGVPTSTLSRIENDVISPTFHQLSKIAAGLEIDFATLVSSRDEAPLLAATGGRRSINLPGEGDVLELGRVKLTYLSADMLQKSFAPVYVEVRARTLEEAGGLSTHAGEEFLYVIEGEIQLLTEHYAALTLSRGASIYFDSSTPHAYVATGETPCKLLSICTVARPHAPPASDVQGDTVRKTFVVAPSNSKDAAMPAKKRRSRRATAPA
jgi:transcriptional regulator with XRE-family HTH domain